jgi:hypothetical protein
MSAKPDAAERRAVSDPEARNVDLPTLVARAERQGVPVGRVDEDGRVRIIRTSEQLREEWMP